VETRQVQLERFLPIQVVAVLSVVAFIGVATFQGYLIFAGKNRDLRATGASSSTSGIARTPYGSVNWQTPLSGASGSTDLDSLTVADADGISNIEGNVVGALLGSYISLNEAGMYTPEDGEKIAESIASSLQASVSYKTYSIRDLASDPDTSYERMLTYRDDLRVALEPLLSNAEYELTLFANYIDTGDAQYLSQLQATAENYKLAIKNAASLTVPQDALSHHAGILNALSEFSTVIEHMAAHAGDPFATIALLKTYNDTETRLFTSFDALASYEKQKQS
jgi:hypothetical protein